MSSIKNLEDNLELKISLIKNKMYDYEENRSDYENWIPFVLYLNLPHRGIYIDEQLNAAMTVFELKKLIKELEILLDNPFNNSNLSYEFYTCEGYFEVKFELVPEDAVVEIEVWINIGVRTVGKIVGFDEGVKFVSDISQVRKFQANMKEELENIINTNN